MATAQSEATFFSFFQAADEVIKIVQQVSEGHTQSESKIAIFATRLSYYQEHAELLDPHLEAIITPLTSALLNAALNKSDVDITKLCILLQCVSKVRGHKSVIKFYPVDVQCFVPILNLLEDYKGKKGEGIWETQCQLMLWMSSLSLIPFDLYSLGDSAVDRIIKISDEFLHEAGTVREFACLLIYRLLTRPDMNKPLQHFLQKSEKRLKKVEGTENVVYEIGLTQAASFIFKHGDRSALLEHGRSLWPVVMEMMQTEKVQNSLLLRKLGTKLVQRLALTLLKPITPKWRYIQTTSRLGSTTAAPSASQTTDEAQDYDIPSEVEEVIQVLLTGVADKDTDVRWSAAKGIGRICSRLPKESADEVLSFILELFSETADDSSWHGACLSVAELARRGLLLPDSIPSLLPLLEKALLYEVDMGSYSVGANVRDSACYVCWACARSFDASIMSPFMPQLSPVLMTTACLDREVNCRRAASAAFQESVGRIGNVPDGMEVLACADYFTLSKRPNAYLNVAPAVAKFKAYGFDFVSHLLFEKVRHWDESLRQLTAEALARMVEVDLEYFTCDVVDHLLAWCLDTDLDQRHGACLALSEVVPALVHLDVEIPDDRRKRIANIVIDIEQARLYRGKGGSLMRQAVSKIIAAVASSHLTRSLNHKLRLLKTLNECIGHPKPEVPPDALKGLYYLSREFRKNEIENAKDPTLNFYLGHLHSENVAFRRGYTLAVGNLPKSILQSDVKRCIAALSEATAIEENEDDMDAESRANAVKSLTSVVIQVYSDSEISNEDFEYLNTDVMQILFRAMEDYSIDRRGDVGSWVREAAMNGLCQILSLLTKSGSVDQALVNQTVAFLLRNSVERISHIRQVSIKNLVALLEDLAINIAHKEDLMKIKEMNEDLISAFGGSNGVISMVRFLRCPEYSKALTEGLIASIGGLEKSLADAVSDAFIAHLRFLTSEEFSEFMTNFLLIFAKHKKCKRMATPVLVTCRVICNSPKLFDQISGDLKAQIVKLVRISLNGSSDFSRLATGASILSVLAFDESQSKTAWTELMVLLVNRYPVVRKRIAETIYEKLLFQEETAETQQMSQLLLETAWDGRLEDVVKERDRMCDLLKIDPPIRKTKKTKASTQTKLGTDEHESYRSLVDDFARGI